MEEGGPGGRGRLTPHRRLPGHGLQGGCGRGRTPRLFAALAGAVVATGTTGTAGTAEIGATAAAAACARVPVAASASTATDARQSQVLMLWGGVTPGGQLRLDPAFVMDAPEKTPRSAGPYRIEVSGGDGSPLLSLDFGMDEISDGGGGFLFMVPFREQWRGELERIVLRGPEGSVTLDRDTHRPMAIVIDRASGQIRAILRGTDAEARIEAMDAEGAEPGNAVSDTRVLVSYGLPRDVPPPSGSR